VSTYFDMYGNICDRLNLVEGENLVRYDATVEVPSEFDEMGAGAVQHRIEDLPDHALVYLLPSRFCLSDLLHDQAWELFGATEPGWARAQAISDWVHGNITFQAGASTPITTAVDVWEKRVGVCRDFAQLGVTFCRSVNIPARYVFGYLPDIGVPAPDEPMDFCAWMEVYLGNRWWTFDPRNNVPRTGRVVIGRGRDALDVAMATTYGGAVLETMQVWADKA
jgi:transglutaminase-like putative cysteine protease